MADKSSVDQIGHRIDRAYMTLDHGGQEQLVSMKQLACGMGMFTLLDASLPNGKGLVKLSTAPDFYFDPAVGEPAQGEFVDPESLHSSRRFGQGAELRMKRYVISYRASGE